MSVRETIEGLLHAALQPVSLEVVDESAAHAGHQGARPGGETHFRVNVTAARFDKVSRLDRHRMVNAALAGLLRSQIHALTIVARAPGEG